MLDGYEWTVLAVTSLFHALAFLAVCVHCLSERRDTAGILFWMGIVFFFPAVGAFLYLTFGVDRMSDTGLRRVEADRKLLAARRAIEQDAAILDAWKDSRSCQIPENPLSWPEQRLNLTLDRLLPDHPLLLGNAIDHYLSGDQAYPAMLEAISNAHHHIHLQSFIIGCDTTGRRFMDALVAKARQGVRVRILFDRFGSTYAYWLGFFRKYRNEPNLTIAGWTLYNPLRGSFMINLRNHRKILVVDGKSAFVGGINIHDGNTTVSRSPIRDYHFRIQGPIVHDLQYTFMRDWYCMTNENPEALLAEKYFPPLPVAGHSPMRLINSGPSSEMELIADTVFAAVTAAREQVIIVTPYFVPPDGLLRALRAAASLGVDVRVITPRNNNHAYAAYAGRGLYEELLQSGVRIYERRGPFIHAKAMIVDGLFALIGTANWDQRSLRLSYESVVAIMDATVAGELKQIVHEEMAQSQEILLNQWQKRGWATRLRENIFLLWRPIL